MLLPKKEWGCCKKNCGAVAKKLWCCCKQNCDAVAASLRNCWQFSPPLLSWRLPRSHHVRQGEVRRWKTNRKRSKVTEGWRIRTIRRSIFFDNVPMYGASLRAYKVVLVSSLSLFPWLILPPSPQPALILSVWASHRSPEFRAKRLSKSSTAVCRP